MLQNVFPRSSKFPVRPTVGPQYSEMLHRVPSSPLQLTMMDPNYPVCQAQASSSQDGEGLMLQLEKKI